MAADPSYGRGASEEIATSTLAEIYAQQGLLGRALAIYRRIQARTPDDPTIAERIARLERRIAEAGAEPEAERAAREPVSTAAATAPVRERLPWDPPSADAVAAPPEAASPADGPEVEGNVRVEPLDPQAFAAWLEGR